MTQTKKLDGARRALTLLENAGFRARLAGGCVRDRLMGREPKDYDIATDARPEKCLKLFRSNGLKVIPTGIEHGTVTVVIDKNPVEITTLRHDVETDGRHAEVSFTESFREDAARRDFTINAMFEDLDGKIYDFFDGQKHIKENLLTFVGKADERIEEDYLRILRFFRFWARFELTPDKGALAACKKHRDGLNKISQERITSELLQTLGCAAVRDSLEALLSTAVLEVILPEVVTKNFELPDARLTHELASLDTNVRPVAQFVSLIIDQPNLDTEALCKKLKLSNKQLKAVIFLHAVMPMLESLKSERADSLNFVDSVEDACGREGYSTLLSPLVHKAVKYSKTPIPKAVEENLLRVDSDEKNHGDLRKKPLPITGNDLMKELKISQGPELGKLMKRLKRSYRNGEWSSKKEALSLTLPSLK